MAIEVRPVVRGHAAAEVIACGTCWEVDRKWPNAEERAFPAPTWVRRTAAEGEVADGLCCAKARCSASSPSDEPGVVPRAAVVIATQGGRQLALCRSHAVMLAGEL